MASQGVSVKLNGQAMEGVKAGGYFTVSREWRMGDVVEVRFEMPVVARQLLSHLVPDRIQPLAVVGRDRPGCEAAGRHPCILERGGRHFKKKVLTYHKAGQIFHSLQRVEGWLESITCRTSWFSERSRAQRVRPASHHKAGQMLSDKRTCAYSSSLNTSRRSLCPEPETAINRLSEDGRSSKIRFPCEKGTISSSVP